MIILQGLGFSGIILRVTGGFLFDAQIDNTISYLHETI
jgi:hypothetical protein